MKLIYVKIPVVSEYVRVYVVNDEHELNGQFLKDQIVFEEKAKWFAKPEKTKDGKKLNFHEMSEDWNGFKALGY